MKPNVEKPPSKPDSPDDLKSLPLLEVEKQLVSSAKGLSQAEAQKRLAQYGPNEIKEKKDNLFLKFLSYFWGPIPWMIEAAVILSGVVKHWLDFFIILFLLFSNAVVAFWEEHQAGNEIAALRAKLATVARALRDGKWATPKVSELVPGDMLKKVDANGNFSCYIYDLLHRITDVGNALQGYAYSPCKRFRYDKASNGVQPQPSGSTLNYLAGRLVEVETDSASMITDEWFSYSPRGEKTDVHELTPHSTAYYHTTVSYWPTGTLETLSGIPGVPTINYGANGPGLDGEGRVTQVSASSGTSPVTSVTYSTSSTANPLGALTAVTFGSADSDSFTYDPNTGRMATYTYSVNSQTDAGALTWNANGTLQKLVINDQIPGTSDSQTCNYLYDDLQRVSTANCGVLWTQNFTYDAFGNISKSVPNGDSGLSFLPTYSSSTNQFTTIPGVTPVYDSDGNLLTDNLNTYTWNAYGNMVR